MDAQPLGWCQDNCSIYSLLSRLARNLSVCATSSPSEWLFSSSGKVLF